MATSPRVSTIEDELDEEQLFGPESGGLLRQQAGKKSGPGAKREQADMRHILGFLNQSEWILSLNIGNIM